jgi:hypothetical protein
VGNRGRKKEYFPSEDLFFKKIYPVIIQEFNFKINQRSLLEIERGRQ